MGFLAFCFLVYIVAGTIWGAWKSKDERAKLAREFNEKPVQHTFFILWVGAIFIFMIGIFVPIFGEVMFFDTGWEIWQVGGVASLVGWVMTMVFPKLL